jgi:hypothetical protein
METADLFRLPTVMDYRLYCFSSTVSLPVFTPGRILSFRHLPPFFPFSFLLSPFSYLRLRRF